MSSSPVRDPANVVGGWMEDFSGKLGSWATSRGLQPADVDDRVNETFYSAFDALAGGNDKAVALAREPRGSERVLYWLTAILRNKVISQGRLKGPKRHVHGLDLAREPDVRQATIEAQLNNSDEKKLLDVLIATLDHDQKAVVILVLNGWSFAEIDERMGRPKGTAWRKFQAALKAMQAEHQRRRTA